MNRRALLRTVGGGVAFVVSGCLTHQNGAKPDQQNDTTSNTSKNKTGKDECVITSEEPGLVKRSFEVVSAGCGSGKSESNVSFETNQVRLSGTINGAESCYMAKLHRVTHENGTLTVGIRSFRPDDAGICSTCLADIEYEATFEFDNELPQRVVVVHNDTEVKKKQRSA